MSCAFSNGFDGLAFGDAESLSLTLAEMRAEVRSRADFKGNFITDAEIDQFLNFAGSRLHDIIITANQDYLLCEATFDVRSSVDNYLLPANFYKVRLVEWATSKNNIASKRTLRPYALAEKNHYTDLHLSPTAPWEWVRYRVQGRRIWFIPITGGGSAASGFAFVQYIPQYLKLKEDGDRVGEYMPVGHEEFMILSACINCREKEQNDASMFLTERQIVEQNIVRALPARESSSYKGPVQTRSMLTGRTIARAYY